MTGDRVDGVAPVLISVVALVRDRQVLLAHRHSSRRSYPDCWDLVGGHLERGESPRQTAIRECREEIGVDVVDPRPFAFSVSDPGLVVHAFVVTQWVGAPVNAAPEEHDDLR